MEPNVLLGVTGSIAAYKSLELIRALRGYKIEVQVMLTAKAASLVGEASFRALSGRPVFKDEWQSPLSLDGMDHITATRQADFFLVAPASADFIAKAAAGIADDLLLAAFLAASCQRCVVPAMNQQMWVSSVTGRNIAQLRADGVQIWGPDIGAQACGEEGGGRFLAPSVLADLVKASLVPSPASFWAGKNVVVSTGATIESIDAMRVISNRSSGEMGFCVARALKRSGANVRLVVAQTTRPAPVDIKVVPAIDTNTMQSVLIEYLATADWFFSVAAVADFRCANPSAGKWSRQKGGMTLSLVATPDILKLVSSKFPKLNCVGFAAQSESTHNEKEGRRKMQNKGVDWLVINSTEVAGARLAQLTLLYNGGTLSLPSLPKAAAAEALIAALADSVSRETGKKNDENG